MKILKTIFQRPVTICLIILVCLTMGFISTSSMAVNLLPDMSFPYMGIISTYIGADAEVVEEKLTDPIEQQVSTVSDLRSTQTYSMDNASIVILEFEYGVSLDDKENELKDCMNGLTLPDGVSYEFTTVDLNSSAVSTLTMYSNSLSIEDVYNKTLDLQAELQTINGVGNVEIKGAPEKTIEITPINGLEFATLLIIQEITNYNSYDIPLGEVINNGESFSIKNSSSIKTLEDVDNLSLSLPLGTDLVATFVSAQAILNYVENLTTDDLDSFKNDYDNIIDFINTIEDSSIEELEEYSKSIVAMKAIINLASYEASTLKILKDNVIMPLVEKQILQQYTDEELQSFADTIGIDYNVLKWLKDNSTTDGSSKTEVEKKLDIIIAYRTLHTGVLTDEEYADLLYLLGLFKITETPRDELADKVHFAKQINTLVFENIIESKRNGEEITNEQYALLLLGNNDNNFIYTGTMIGYIRDENFQQNFDALYEFKKNHQHEEEVIDEDTNYHHNVLVGDELTAEEFMELYNGMSIDLPVDVKLTADLIDFVRKSTFSGDKAYTKLEYMADVNIKTDYSSFAMYNNLEAIQILVYANSDANSTSIVENVEAKINEYNANSEDAKVVMLDNQAAFINDSLSNALVSLIIGGLLAILIIYLFLRKIPSSIIIAVSMPLSILCTLICLYLMGITLNMVSVGGLAVGIGMLVDNSIVVLESIASEREKGKSALEASLDGVKLVVVSLIGSTLTSICVFFPILLMPGLTREIFSDLAWAVIFSLTFSLLVAVVIIPTLYCLVYKRYNKKEKESGKFMNKLKTFYEKLLTKALKKKVIVLLSALAIFIASIALVFTSPIEFLPSIDEQKIEVNIAYNTGDDFTYCKNNSEDVYNFILDNIDDIKTSSINVSKQGMLSTNMAGVISIQLNKNAKKTADVAEEIREQLHQNFDLNISVKEIDGVVATLTGGFNGVSLSIKGEDVDTLKEIASKVEEDILSNEGIVKASDDFVADAKSYTIQFDNEQVVEKGLTYSTLVTTLRVGLAGYDLGEVSVDDSDLTVNVTWNESAIGEYYPSIEEYVVSYNSDGTAIYLKDIATIEEKTGRYLIRKIDGENVITIAVESYGIDTNTASNITKKSARKILKDYEGYSYVSGGVAYYLTDAFTGLVKALIIAFFLLFAIMACLFESLRKPFIVIFSFPFAFTGGFIALAITRVSLNVVSFIGLIMLMGVVVNDAIVLIERYAQLEEVGMDRSEAIIKGSKQRLRAVLMTSCTTILALIPMALGFGKGGALMQPLGVVAIGGLLIGTLVTMIIIPIVYSLIMKSHTKKEKKVKPKKNKEVKEEAPTTEETEAAPKEVEATSEQSPAVEEAPTNQES